MVDMDENISKKKHLKEKLEEENLEDRKLENLQHANEDRELPKGKKILVKPRYHANEVD